MVFGIIQRHCGSIEVESEPGKGTTFVLRLPASSEESWSAPDAIPWKHRPLHILVADDQPILNKIVCEYLQADFHTVETALSGDEALEIFRSTDFDLVICDHVMDGITGEQLAIKIKEINPQTPVILLTGYGGSVDIEHLSPAIDLIVAKPVSPAALRHALAKVMPPV
jgi:CheY-like chemotaxis protein